MRWGWTSTTPSGFCPNSRHPQVGESLPLAEGFAVPYAVVDAPRTLVVHGDTRTGSVPMPGLRPGDHLAVQWGWYLEAIDDHTTRFIERWRADYGPGVMNTLLYRLFLEPGAFIMERKMLQGIKARAEKSSVVSETAYAPAAV